MRPTYPFAFLIILLACLLVTNLSIGAVHIPLDQLIQILLGQEVNNDVWKNIVWDFRMTKALTCILAGSALAISGLLMQTLFRNALAGPDVLGLSSGASLAVSLLILGQSSGIVLLPAHSTWTIALAAGAGCALVFVVMFSLATKLRDNVSLLIVGLMVGAGTSSIVSVLQYSSRAEDLQTFIIWTFGSLGSLNWNEINVLLIILLVGSLLAILCVKSLNAWLLGDNYASSIGINLKRSRVIIILSASILTGGVTAFCGPIAFVGLAVPHLIKIIIKTHNHKILIPAVMIGGSVLLLFCDTVSQLPGEAKILPVNAITALIGAPVVIWVILRNRIVI
ncbi:MAG TPA: iron ABC transporter permease [Ohtaekwangia sp.]|nr:iron ABC transporter permease [Ohtaekwangia sp.]